MVGMCLREIFSRVRVATLHGVGDRGMFGPDRLGRMTCLQHRDHHAAHLSPNRRRGVRHHWIPGYFVKGRVKGHITVDERRGRPVSRGFFPDLERGIEPPRDLRRRGFRGQLGGQPGRQAIEGGSKLVDMANERGIHRRHAITTLARRLDQPVSPQHAKGLNDRLARDVQVIRQLFLAQHGSRRKPPGTHRLHKAFIDFVRQAGAMRYWGNPSHGELVSPVSYSVYNNYSSEFRPRD